MVVIYAEKSNPRLHYVLEEIFRYRLGVDYTFTTDKSQFMQAEAGTKINYSSDDIAGVQILPSAILFENDINDLTPEFFEENDLPILFKNPKGFTHDIFAMTFWYLSRYEEYQGFSPDKHGRFEKISIFSGLPVLDMALNKFYGELNIKPQSKYAVYPTVDIDIAFKHKGRSFFRWMGGIFKMLISGNFAFVKERIAVLFGSQDPFDSFDYIIKTLTPFKDRARFFIQVSTNSDFDKSIHLTNKEFAKRIKELSSSFDIDMHPGYYKGKSADGIMEEKKSLENFIGKKIARSRHHFLKIQIPETYENLISADISHDYSMGFAGQPGFRAGTAQSFRFFNLRNNSATSLVIHPFCVMDVSLKNYQKLNAEKAVLRIHELKDICQKNGTPFCFIFHNESLSESGEWLGWRKVFEACLK